jgi:hypothetical protein
MNRILRDQCAVTKAQDLEPLYKQENIPVFMGCVEHPEERDLFSNMDWSISRSSGLIQLRWLLPLDELYPASHNAGAIGTLWERHHREFAEFIHQYEPSAVLEIGGASGILARDYQQLKNINWTIVEPNPAPVSGCNARFIKGFFNNTFALDEPVDTVVHSHVFEHIYDTDQFMQHLAGFIEEGQRLLFSLPNLQIWLERRYTTCLNFEHTVFLTEPYVEYLLAKYGFRLEEKKYFMEDHSIFYAAIRTTNTAPYSLPDSLYHQNKQLYLDYVEYHVNLINELNRQLLTEARPVYLFGAHVFAQSLIGFGLDQSRIVSLLDNDSQKQGRRLYGTKLMVQSPSVLRDVKSPCVILKTGVYNKEIKEDILSNINPNVEFLE